MVDEYKVVHENEKPLTTRFWTIDMILLAILNIAFLSAIFAGLVIIYLQFSKPVAAWLNHLFGI